MAAFFINGNLITETPTESYFVNGQYVQAETIPVDVTISDSVGITDSISNIVETATLVSLSDSIGITDSISNPVIYFKESDISDSVGVTDSITTEEITTPIYDSVDITDSISQNVTKASIQSENISVSDTFTSTVTLIVNISDDVGITDKRLLANENKNFSLTKPDIWVENAGYGIFKTTRGEVFYHDTKVTNDHPEYTLLEQTISDSISITETYFEGWSPNTIQKTISESIDVTDETIGGYQISPDSPLSDDIGITDDIPEIYLGAGGEILDSVDVTDSKPVLKNLKEFQINLPNIYIGNQFIRRHSSTDRLFVNNGQTIYDQPDRTIYRREINENVSVSDNTDAHPGFPVDLSDSVGITDAIDGVKGFIYGISDTIGITDSNSYKNLARYADDSVGIVDELNLKNLKDTFEYDAPYIYYGNRWIRRYSSTNRIYSADYQLINDNPDFTVINIDLSESVGVSDSITGWTGQRRDVFDSVEIIDDGITPLTGPYGLVYENIEIADSRLQLRNLTPGYAVIHPYIVGESRIHAYDGDTQQVYPSESVIFNNKEDVNLVEVSLDDIVVITETTVFDAKPAILPQISDSIDVQDELIDIAYKVKFVTLQENISVSEYFKAQRYVIPTLTENINISDSIDPQSYNVQLAAISESVTVEESFQAFVVYQTLTFQYGEVANAQNFNRIGHYFFPTGIYTGGLLVRDTNYIFHITPLTCYIADQVEDLSVSVTTSENISLTANTSKPYVVLRMIWRNVEGNYMDVHQLAYNEIEEHDLIIGRCIFNEGLLTSNFDYSKRSNPVFPELEANRFNLKVFAKSPPSNKVFVNSGEAFFLNKRVNISSQDSPVLSDTINGRIDLIYVDTNGNIQVEEGADSSTPIAPSYNGKFVLAEVERIGTKNVIIGDEITNITYDRFYPQEFGLQTQGNGSSLIGMGGSNNLTDRFGTNLQDYTLNLLTYFRLSTNTFNLRSILENGTPVGIDRLSNSITQTGIWFRQFTSIRNVIHYKDNIVMEYDGGLNFWDLNPDGDIISYSSNNGVDIISPYTLNSSVSLVNTTNWQCAAIGDGTTVDQWAFVFRDDSTTYPILSVGYFDGSNNEIVFTDQVEIQSSGCDYIQVIGYGTNQFCVRVDDFLRFGHLDSSTYDVVWDTTLQSVLVSSGSTITGTVESNTIVVVANAGNPGTYSAYSSSGSTITTVKSATAYPNEPESASVRTFKVYNDDFIVFVAFDDVAYDNFQIVGVSEWNSSSNSIENKSSTYIRKSLGLSYNYAYTPELFLSSTVYEGLDDNSEPYYIVSYLDGSFAQYQDGFFYELDKISLYANIALFTSFFATDSQGDYHYYSLDKNDRLVESVSIPYLGLISKPNSLFFEELILKEELTNYSTESDGMRFYSVRKLISLEQSNLYVAGIQARTINTPYTYYDYIILFSKNADTGEVTVYDIHELEGGDGTTKNPEAIYDIVIWRDNQILISTYQYYFTIDDKNRFRLFTMENNQLIPYSVTEFTGAVNRTYYMNVYDFDHLIGVGLGGTSLTYLVSYSYDENTDQFIQEDSVTLNNMYTGEVSFEILQGDIIATVGRDRFGTDYININLHEYDINTETFSEIATYEDTTDTATAILPEIQEYINGTFILRYGYDTDEKERVRIGHYDGNSDIVWDSEEIILNDEFSNMDIDTTYRPIMKVIDPDANGDVAIVKVWNDEAYAGIFSFEPDSWEFTGYYGKNLDAKNIDYARLYYNESKIRSNITQVYNKPYEIFGIEVGKLGFGLDYDLLSSIFKMQNLSKGVIVVNGYLKGLSDLEPGKFYKLTEGPYTYYPLGYPFVITETTYDDPDRLPLKALSFDTMLIGINHQEI